MVDTSVSKRDGRIEDYDRRKLLASIISACLSVRTPEGSAEMTAQKVSEQTEEWLAKKPEVTSADIRRKAAETLLAYNPEAAYIYKQQRMIS